MKSRLNAMQNSNNLWNIEKIMFPFYAESICIITNTFNVPVVPAL